MTVDEVKKLAQMVSEKKAQWEELHGTYDCKASIMAAHNFAQMAQSIMAKDEYEFLALLFDKINIVKANMQSTYAGELNGGKGMLMSCYNTLESVMSDTDKFSEARRLLKSR